MSLPNGRPVLPTLRWRDLLPGVLSFLAQPIALVALVGLAAFTAGRCSSTPARVVEWKTRADALTNRDALSVFHGKQSAGADTARKALAVADSLKHVADSLAERLTHRPPTPTPKRIPATTAPDSTLYLAGFDAGFTEGWHAAAAEGLNASVVYHTATDTAMAAGGRLGNLREEAVSRADTLNDVTRQAPIPGGKLDASTLDKLGNALRPPKWLAAVGGCVLGATAAHLVKRDEATGCGMGGAIVTVIAPTKH